MELTTTKPFAGVTSNSVSGSTLHGATIGNCIGWPSGGYGYTTVSSEPVYPVKIRIVANGFILKMGGAEYVFSKPAELFKFLEKELVALK